MNFVLLFLQLTVAIDFHIIFFHNMEVNGYHQLHGYLHSSKYHLLKKKETLTGLEQFEGNDDRIFISLNVALERWVILGNRFIWMVHIKGQILKNDSSTQIPVGFRLSKLKCFCCNWYKYTYSKISHCVWAGKICL